MKLKEIKIELTNKCYLKCIHCSTDGSLQNNVFLPFFQIKKIITQSHNSGCREIALSGGEPLLYPELGDLIRILQGKGFKHKVYTTGIVGNNPISSISFSDLKKLKSQGLTNFAVSLHSSNANNHDRITGFKGSFEATVKTICNSLQLGVATEVHFVVMKSNLDDLFDLVSYIKKIGVSKVSLLRFVPQGRGSLNETALIPDSYDYNRLRSIVSKLRKTNTMNIRLGSPFNFLLLGNPKECHSGLDRLIIDAEGFVYPCDALKRFEHSGDNNVFSKSLLDIFANDPLFNLARSKDEAKSCSICPAKNKCQSGCIAQRILCGVNLDNQTDPGCLLNDATSSGTRIKQCEAI